MFNKMCKNKRSENLLSRFKLDKTETNLGKFYARLFGDEADVDSGICRSYDSSTSTEGRGAESSRLNGGRVLHDIVDDRRWRIQVEDVR